MITKSFLASFIIFSCIIRAGFSQVYTGPAVGLKSHQTMEVISVEATPEKTVLHLSIENRRAGGTFCADRNIFIIQPGGSRLKLEKSSGIPACPDVHRFRKTGEILRFSLTFPALEPGGGWIDLKEDCNENCFSIYGILLNNAFSLRIDEAWAYVNKNQVDIAIGLYQKLIKEAGSTEAGIAGSLYSDLISLLDGKGYKANAAEWYRKLVESDLPWKELYISNLNSRGIKY